MFEPNIFYYTFHVYLHTLLDVLKHALYALAPQLSYALLVCQTTLSRCDSSGYGPCAVICRQDLLTVSHCEFEFIKSLSNLGAPLRVGAQVSQGSCWGLTRLARPALWTPGMGRCVGETPPSLCALLSSIFLFLGLRPDAALLAMIIRWDQGSLVWL